MKTHHLLVATLLLAALTACTTPNRDLIENAPLISKHFDDGLGRHIELPRKPKRVVALAPEITETIFAIGAGPNQVGRSHLCDYPGEVLDLPEIVTFPDFDLPTVATLSPDLVLASTEVHDARIAPFFERYNIPIAFLNYDNVPDILENIETVGAMLEYEVPAKQLSDSLRRIGLALADSTKGQVRYKTVMLLNVDPIIVAGGSSFQNDLLRMAGADNPFGNNPEKYPTITAQQLLQAAPEYLLIPSNDDQSYAKLIELHPELHLNLPAAINKHVFQMEPDLVLRPGPRIMEGLAYLIRVLHARINTDAVFSPEQ